MAMTYNEATRLPLNPVTRIITITQHRNFGVLADLPVPRWLILTCTGLAIIFLLRWSFYYLTTDKLWEMLPLTLILGGALSNLWDRLVYGYVFDWILLFQYSVINLADITIGVGIAWFVINRFKKISAPGGKTAILPPNIA